MQLSGSDREGVPREGTGAAAPRAAAVLLSCWRLPLSKALFQPSLWVSLTRQPLLDTGFSKPPHLSRQPPPPRGTGSI